MKISLEWLKEYVEYNDSVDRLQEILTNIGFPVEQTQQVGDDWMLDVEITSNRPDCLGHIGLAREVAAATGANFHLPEVSLAEQGPGVQARTSVVNEAPQYCRRYTARLIDNIKVGPSPDWMRRRLETIGLRSISNVVDITNYVLMEAAQPLHSFDYAHLQEGKIIVRTAKPGEKIETIDHTQFELSEDMLVIADAQKAVALAGVMGGLASEVSDNTKTVLLESAHFDPLSIRKTSRTFSQASESSFRFERNVDIEMVEWASRRAAALLVELAGGEVAPGVIDVWPDQKESAAPNEVRMRLSRLRSLVGIEFKQDYVLGLFEKLQLSPRADGDDIIICSIPSWRGDLIREVDLIEEVIRIFGYDQVPTESKIHITVTTTDAYQRTLGKVNSTLIGCGFFEAINVSFIEDKYWQPFVEDGFEPVRVRDITRRSNNALRPSLLPSLLETTKRNQDAGNDRCDLYEVAAVYLPGTDEIQSPEPTKLALATMGDFRELRGVMEAVIDRLSPQVKLSCRPAPIHWARRAEGVELLINEQVIGQAGRASEEITKIFDLNQPLSLAQLDFSYLVELEGEPRQLQPIIRFPGITRDLSLLLDDPVSWAQIEQTILSLGIQDLRELNFVGIYRGQGIPARKKSLTLSMIFRHTQDTLRHEQADEYQEKIVRALQEKFQAELRG